jgi:uncharacterized protein YceK
MGHRVKWVGFAVVATFASGCGTAHNVAPDVLPFPYVGTQDRCADATQVYGGVKRDWYALTGKQWDWAYSPVNLLLTPLYLLDLPLSAVADTLTLPYAIWNEIGMNWKAGMSMERCQWESLHPETAFHPSTLTEWLTGLGSWAVKEQPNDQPSPQQSNPADAEAPPRNVFAPLAGNKFNSWTLSPRVEIEAAKSR